jgi:hypothetical protein
MLVLHFSNDESHLDHLPALRDGTQKGDGRPTACLEVVGMGLSSGQGNAGSSDPNALDRATHVEVTLMQCHYYSS